MNNINSIKTGLVLGSIFSLYHALWSLLVFSGYAKAFLDFILKLHFITLEYNIEPFNFLNALALITLTGAIGFIMGYIGSNLWNLFHQ